MKNKISESTYLLFDKKKPFSPFENKNIVEKIAFYLDDKSLAMFHITNKKIYSVLQNNSMFYRKIQNGMKIINLNSAKVALIKKQRTTELLDVEFSVTEPSTPSAFFNGAVTVLIIGVNGGVWIGTALGLTYLTHNRSNIIPFIGSSLALLASGSVTFCLKRIYNNKIKNDMINYQNKINQIDEQLDDIENQEAPTFKI